MKKHSNGNSHLFFIEFLIVLFFFFIISTVCLKLFVHAFSITKSADTLSHAQSMAASAAELLLSGADSETASSCLSDLFPEEDYILTITETNPDTANDESFVQTYSISVFDPDHHLIYELPLTLNTPIDRNTALALYAQNHQEVLP